MPNIKWIYGEDPTGEGFFCPQLVQKRRDYFTLKILRPAETEAVYQCRPGARIGSIFVESDFRYYDCPMGLVAGVQAPDVAQWIRDSGGFVAQGWDTAMSATSSANPSACVTVLFLPCTEFHREKDAIVMGTCDQHYDVYVLDVYREKLEIGDLTLQIRRQFLKWRPEKIIIERKSSGVSAMQALANSGLPIEGAPNSVESKRDRAINGGANAGSVQGWFKAGRVLFPPDWLPWMPDFTRELKDFTGERGGVDDQVDAMVHVITYGIREGSLVVHFPSGWESPEAVDASMYANAGLSGVFRPPSNSLDPVAEIMTAIQVDPFQDTCGRCMHFKSKHKNSCTFHNRSVGALYPACPAFESTENMLVTGFPRY